MLAGFVGAILVNVICKTGQHLFETSLAARASRKLPFSCYYLILFATLHLDSFGAANRAYPLGHCRITIGWQARHWLEHPCDDLHPWAGERVFC
jgi:hypothetical protein